MKSYKSRMSEILIKNQMINDLKLSDNTSFNDIHTYIKQIEKIMYITQKIQDTENNFLFLENLIMTTQINIEKIKNILQDLEFTLSMIDDKLCSDKDQLNVYYKIVDSIEHIEDIMENTTYENHHLFQSENAEKSIVEFIISNFDKNKCKLISSIETFVHHYPRIDKLNEYEYLIGSPKFILIHRDQIKNNIDNILREQNLLSKNMDVLLFKKNVFNSKKSQIIDDYLSIKN